LPALISRRIRDVGERLQLGAITNSSSEELVLNHHASHADLLQLPDEARMLLKLP